MIRYYEPEYKDDLVNLGKQYDIDFEKKFLNNKDKILLFIQDNKVLGFLIIEETVDESSIILLFVDKDNRKRKIGSYLLDYFISGLKVSKKRILLEVSSNNTPAINLYKKFGFTTINNRKKYYKDGSDALVMERSISYE